VARTKLPLRVLTSALLQATESATPEEVREFMASLQALDTLSPKENRKAISYKL
jgi:hypothetical protein